MKNIIPSGTRVTISHPTFLGRSGIIIKAAYNHEEVPPNVPLPIPGTIYAICLDCGDESAVLIHERFILETVF